MTRWNRADFFLLTGLVLAGCVLGLILLLRARPGKLVQVRVDGLVTAVYSLDTDGRYVISGADGGENLLVIQDGKASVSQASCPDGLCVHMGSISLEHQSIVCLPNRVVVEIVSEAHGESIDLISG